MAYDALAESLRLLGGEPPAARAALSRRTRHVALAVDRDGDVAATLFLRRGVSGMPFMDVHTFELLNGGWRILGGGSGGPSLECLRPRPTLRELGAPAETHGSGGTVRNAERLMPWGARWVRYAKLYLAQEVATLRVGHRVLPVAEHGVAVVVWSRKPPQVAALDDDGVLVGLIAVRDR